MEGEIVSSQEEKQKGKKFGSDALLLSGAVLLTGLIIAGSVILGTEKLSKVLANLSISAPKADIGTQQQQPDEPTVTMDQIQGLFNGKNITFGKKNAKVVFVEFSDPSCPYCNIAAGQNPNLNKSAGPQFTMVKDGGKYVAPVPEMKKLVDAGKASFVWVYANGHGNGEMGTKALYCGFEKKKFWEVHDLLMSEAGYNLMNNDVKNDKSKAGVIAEFLKSAVKPGDMQSCLESGKYDGRIAEDSAIATTFGMSGTPKFFVNTENFKGAYSFTDMQSVVDKYLK
ncbi:MAG: DsbA family protein [Candidatus Moranbacteria bacterium]|nr:DsbA family protein [Candidatus Moranbacteria bacterium]MDD3964687.1 DsbA family protein [Candidatus Moranbacteria bacterium]